MVEDIQELEEMDASEIHARRLNAKEVVTPMKGDNFIFPVSHGTEKIRRERRLLPSTLTWERPARGEAQLLQGESDDLSSPTFLHRDAAEAKRFFFAGA